jgi:hypothetical protein
MVYYVLIINNFDGDSSLYKCKDEDEATDLLLYLWEDYYNTEIANNSYLDEAECFHEDTYAKISWIDGCHTEFIMISGEDKIPNEFYNRTRR